MATETLSTPGAGTYTVPAGVFELQVESIGAGGGGSGGAVGGSHEGSGGAGGARQTATFAVTPAQQLSYSIGVGGTGGAADNEGGNGGATSFDGVTTASGGSGGQVMGSGGAPPSGNSDGGGGGAGEIAGGNAGGGGGSRTEADAGGNTGTVGGFGGAGGSVGGGNGATVADTAGGDGTNGGGGGGGKGNAAGGAGGNGRIFLTYTVRTAATDITLDDASIPENSSVGDTVGSLTATDADAGDTHTFSLTNDAGGRFSIAMAALKVAGALNYEAAASHTISVRATDSYGLTFDKDFVISVTNVNEVPTAIQLSGSSVSSGSASGTTVGTLSATDPDAGDSVTFSLSPATLDNDDFTIDGTSLKIGFTADAETRDAYTVTVTAHDEDGATFDENFTITITADDAGDEEQYAMTYTISTPLSEGLVSDLSSSTAMTVPAKARRLIVWAIAQNVRAKFSGTPTASAGFQIIAGQSKEFLLDDSPRPRPSQTVFETMRFIEETSGAKLYYAFFSA